MRRGLPPMAFAGARAGLFCLCSLTLLMLGCSGRGECYPLSGKVTFAGEPVPFGRIELIPDPSLGKKGARSTIEFRDGRYETPKSQYVAGGSHLVKIDGFKYVGDSEGDETAEMVRLFPLWSSHVELPATGGAFDFDIPALAARR